MRRALAIAGLMLMVLLTAGSLAPAPAVPPPAPPQAQDPEKPKSNLELAREAMEAIDALAKSGRQASSDTIYTWSLRLSRAESAIARNKSERIKAVQDHVRRVRNLILREEALRERGESDLMDTLEAKYRYNEALAELKRVETE